MKNSHKLVGIAIIAVLTLGTALSLAVNSNSDLTGRVQLTKEESLKLRKEIGSRKENASKQKVKKSVEPDLRLPAKTNAQRNDFIGNGVLPDGVPVIETYIGACNDPFGTPTCVVDGQYTTYDLAYNGDEVVYTMRVKNTSTTTPIYMDKVFLEYYVKGIDQTVWNRTEWKIYDASAPSTLLTRGHVYNAANVNGYVDFDWSYPGSLSNPINQPPVILPLGTQTYIVTADIVDDTAGPSTFDYVQVRANDSLTFTPVMGGTLADAHSVDSHFIWHTASGLYYNEGYTDLMDMWGGVPNAFAQWRKRMWGGPVCGNGSVETGEACDDGNLINGDGCANSCQYEFCGDGYLDLNGGDNVSGSPDDEACDDGNAINGDGCSMVCEVEAPTTVTFEDYYETIGSISPQTYWLQPQVSHNYGVMPVLFTTTGDVTLPQLRMYIDGELITSSNGTDLITTGECNNLGQLSNVLSNKYDDFNAWSTTFGSMAVNHGPVIATSGAYNVSAPSPYGEPVCEFEAYVDLDLSAYTFSPAVSHEINLNVDMSDKSWPFEHHSFSLNNLQSSGATVVNATLGTPIPSSNISVLAAGLPTTNPFVGDTIDYWDNRLLIQAASSTPGNAAGSPLLQYSAGSGDVILGAFVATNQSQADIDLSSFKLTDYMNAFNPPVNDLSDIKIYEWDPVNQQIVGPPISFPHQMNSSDHTINMYFSSPITVQSLASGNNQFFFAITADISGDFEDVYGSDVIWDAGSSDDDNELQVIVSDAMASFTSFVGPVLKYYGSCSPTGTTPVMPYNLNGNLNPLLGCFFYPDTAVGPLIDITPPSTPLAMVQFSPLPSSEPYESIIVPTGSGLGNAVKVADVRVHDLGISAGGLELERLKLTNDDGVSNFVARFGTFYLVDDVSGSLIDTAALMDVSGPTHGTLTFDGFNWVIPSGTYADLEVHAEVMPITQAAHSGAWINFYLAGTVPSEIELLDLVSANYLLPSEITNFAGDADPFQQFHVTRRTKPYVSYNNGAIVTNIAGTVSSFPFYQFTVSADSAGDLDWKAATFEVLETPGMTSNVYSLYDLASGALIGTSSLVGGEVHFSFTPPQIIPAGTSKTYQVKANLIITNTPVSQNHSSTLSAADDVSLITSTSTGVPVLAPGTDFIWSDRSSPTHTLFTADWTNGYLVEEFDVDTVNINYSGTGGGPVSYTRTDLLTDLFSIKGQPLMSGPSGCLDTTSAQEPVWATAINLGIISPYSTGFCGPNDPIVRAEASKILASYSAFVSGGMTIISPSVQTFPDVLLAAWYFDWVESMYAAMGSVYAIAGSNFYPGNLLDSVTAVTWITNLP